MARARPGGRVPPLTRLTLRLRQIRRSLAQTQPRSVETGRFEERGPWWNDTIGYRPIGAKDRTAEDYGTVFVQIRHRRKAHTERPKREPLFDVFIGVVEHTFPAILGERVIAFSVKDSILDRSDEALVPDPVHIVPRDYVASTGYPIGGPWEVFAFEVYSSYRSHPVPRKTRRAIERSQSGRVGPTRGPPPRGFMPCLADLGEDGLWR